MEANIVFKVKGNQYILNKNIRVISFLPISLYNVLYNGDTSDEYYVRKKEWLGKYGFLDNELAIDYKNFLVEDFSFCVENLEQIVFEVTDKCNLQCEYCGYGNLYNDYDPRTGETMSFDLAKTCLEYMFDKWNSYSNKRRVYISFYGGEPLMNMPLIKQIVDFVRENVPDHIQIVFGITTNAVLLNKYMDYLVDNDFSILFSLDGNKYNNSYRMFKGKAKIESFDIVYKNIKELQIKYPKYFSEKVNINAVLHDRNSVSDILDFIYNEFGIIARIGELNPMGINPKYENKYEFMKKNTQESINVMPDSILKDKYFMNEPNKRLMFEFLNDYTGNIFSSYNKLFINQKYRIRRMTGTCIPFEKKMFITVGGKILPCTSISQKYSLGKALKSNFELDFDSLYEKYKNWLNSMKSKCDICYNEDTCRVCVFNLKQKDNGEFVCDKYMNKRMFQKYLSYVYSAFVDNASDYLRIMKKAIIQ